MKSRPALSAPTFPSKNGAGRSAWAGAPSTLLVLIVAVMMVVPMPMPMLMLMVMQPLSRPWPARVLAEHQRLDGDRHGVGRHADAAEIDVVEVHQGDAVDHQDLARHIELLAQNRAERLRHVALQHDVDRLPLGDPRRQGAPDAFGETREALI